MRIFFILILSMLCSHALWAQFDEDSQRMLDSLGVKFDPNDPDGEQKLLNDLQKAIQLRYDSVQEVAKNTAIDPFNVEGLRDEILRDFAEENDTLPNEDEFPDDLLFLTIDLNSPDSRFFSEGVFTLPQSLKILFISGSNQDSPVDLNSLFSALPNTISELYITNTHEAVSEIPESIGDFTNLEVLALYGNHITDLPSTIGNLQQMEKLYVDINPIERLPESIENLKKLKVLGIAQTSINTTEQAMIQKNLPNCKILLQ